MLLASYRDHFGRVALSIFLTVMALFALSTAKAVNLVAPPQSPRPAAFCVDAVAALSDAEPTTPAPRHAPAAAFLVRHEALQLHPYINHHPEIKMAGITAPFSTALDLTAWIKSGRKNAVADYAPAPPQPRDISLPFSLVVSRRPTIDDRTQSAVQDGSLVTAKGNNRNALRTQSSAVNYKSNYKSYSAQGPERRSIAPLAESQDVEDFAAGRITTFSLIDELDSFSYQNFWGKLIGGGSAEYISVKAQPVGQLHVLLSRSSAEPLHTEVVTPVIAREKDERIAELCRLHFIEGNALNNESRNARDQYGKMRLIRELFRQAYSFMLNDAGIKRVFYQVNQKMLERIKEYGIPTELAKTFQFDREYENAEGEKVKVTEFRLEFDRAAMRRTEENLVASNLAATLERFLAAVERYKYYYPEPSLELHLALNQIPALERLSILNFTSHGGGRVINTLDQHYLEMPSADENGVWQINSSLRPQFLMAFTELTPERAKKMLLILKSKVPST